MKKWILPALALGMSVAVAGVQAQTSPGGPGPAGKPSPGAVGSGEPASGGAAKGSGAQPGGTGARDSGPSGSAARQKPATGASTVPASTGAGAGAMETDTGTKG